jgi:hypothetical protein
MSTLDPQFLYIILVLPGLFGFILLGEGLNKVIHEERGGVLPVIFGLMFIGAVAFAYFFFSTYLAAHRVV